MTASEMGDDDGRDAEHDAALAGREMQISEMAMVTASAWSNVLSSDHRSDQV